MANTKGYGEDMMSSRRCKQAAMLLLGITLLAYSPVALAAEGAPRLLGTVVASGNASMKAGLDRWVPVDEKTHPVVDGTCLKTEDGAMSVTMKDGASVEIGKRTDLVIGGALSDYSMKLQLGTIAFKIYQGTGLSVTTPSTSVVVQRVSGSVENTRHTFKDEINGIITYDGKETQVICLRGKFTVMQAAAETTTLTEGNTVTVESPQTVTQAQGATSTGSGTPAASSGTVKVYENPTKVPELAEPAKTGGEILQQVQTGGLEVGSESTP
jgi:ferric-dicitrate binding protein FerR (iron transport regulator)